MENIKGLNLVFVDLITHIDEIVKDCGEPAKPLAHEIDNLKNQIINNPSNNNSRLQKSFYLIERVAGDILFSYNVDKYLGLKGEFDLMTFLSYIDDGTYSWNYLRDYLTWAKCAYTFAMNNFRNIEVEKFAYKIRIPMRCVDGRIYWVLQEVRPLETDANNNLISHINTYTICNLYKEKSPVGLIGEFYFDDEYHEEWNKVISENRFSLKPFLISPTQKEILFFYFNHPNTSLKTCAEELKYPVNTLKKYISDSQRKHGIIDMAKISFPQASIHSMKEVVTFLNKIGWFS